MDDLFPDLEDKKFYFKNKIGKEIRVCINYTSKGWFCNILDNYCEHGRIGYSISNDKDIYFSDYEEIKEKAFKLVERLQKITANESILFSFMRDGLFHQSEDVMKYIQGNPNCTEINICENIEWSSYVISMILKIALVQKLIKIDKNKYIYSGHFLI